MGVVAFIMKQPPLLMKVHLHESGKKCLPTRSCFFQVMLALCLVISQSPLPGSKSFFIILVENLFTS